MFAIFEVRRQHSNGLRTDGVGQTGVGSRNDAGVRNLASIRNGVWNRNGVRGRGVAAWKVRFSRTIIGTSETRTSTPGWQIFRISPPIWAANRVHPMTDSAAPGDGTFNAPPLVEAAVTGLFFHNNAIETIEGSVAFYDGEAFNNSPAGKLLAASDPNGVGIDLDGTQLVAIAVFLRVINAFEKIRQSVDESGAHVYHDRVITRSVRRSTHWRYRGLRESRRYS
jgi:hypothetical protein